MNEHKISFILCVDNLPEAEETAVYIKNLTVPHGFETDIVFLQNVVSKATEYNKAMRQSDAKYKIYLRDDVRIIEKDFIAKMIELFTNHPSVGMLGVVGRRAPLAVTEENIYEGGTKYGKILADYVDKREECSFPETEREFEKVLLLEDYLLATQYDVPWREELFTERAFCEYSQSIEFWKAGYEVVVPRMFQPWCFVDNAEEKKVENSKWRSEFRKEYREFCNNWEGYFSEYINEPKELTGELPLVSVLISVYNAENIIEDTLRSVMNQTYPNLQIIVVDDCSKDRTREIIDWLAEEDSRIVKVYMPKNFHVCKASNEGYKFANGKYIAIIGHDDIWNPDKIEKQVKFMEANPNYAVAFTLVDIIDDNGRISNGLCKNVYELFDQHNRTQEEWVSLLYSGINVFCAPSAMIRRACLQDRSLYQFGLVQLQDYALWFDLLKEYPVYIIRERLMKYRQFLRSKSNLSYGTNKIAQRLSNERNYIFKNVIMNMTDEQFIRFFGRHFRCFDSCTKEELQCEKAFILMTKKNYYCIGLFIELFEEEKTRDLLENKYGFYLTNFYELNCQMYF